MNNQDLFNFNFVDRTLERDETNEFLISQNENFHNVLWIVGDKNVGKSFFVKNILQENKISNYLYIDLDKDTHSLSNSLMIFLNQLNTRRLFKYINSHYLKVIKLMTDVSAYVATAITKIDFSTILSMLTDSISIFEKSDGTRHDASNLLTEYIKKYYKDISYVILDHLANCDDQLLLILGNIIAKLIEDTPIRFIVITETEEVNQNAKLRSLMIQQLPHTKIEIKPMTDYKLFAEILADILADIFDFSNIGNDLLKYIFNYCDGYPGRLKNLIESLYLNDNIVLNNNTDRAEINTENINEILDCGICEKTEINDFLEELVFKVIIISKWNLKNKELIELVYYICNEEYHIELKKQDINISIRKMVSKKILSDYYIDNALCIGLSKSFNYSHLYSIVSKDSSFPPMCKLIYNYLEITAWSINNCDKNRAWYSWKALIPNWIQINYEIGENYYNNGDMLSSCEIFLHLQTVLQKLSTTQRYVVAKSFYFCGKYENSVNTIMTLVNSQISYQDFNELGLDYCILMAKCFNITMKKKKAVELLSNIYNYVNPNSDEAYLILDLKHRILANIKYGRKKSKNIYDYLRKKIKNNSSLYDAIRLTSMEYYRGELVQNDLDDLIKKYHMTSTVLEGECYTNKGFDLFWQGKINEAITSFKNSLIILENVRIHEISYVLNNLANCHMMQGDFESAIADLHRASAFNQSQYVDIVIKTNLMVCYAIKNNSLYKKLFKELLTIYALDEPLDISILLKVTYALEFVYEINGFGFEFIKNLTSSIAIANDYEKDVLPYLWLKNWNDDVENDIRKRLNNQNCDMFFSYRFDPWLVTITHD